MLKDVFSLVCNDLDFVTGAIAVIVRRRYDGRPSVLGSWLMMPCMESRRCKLTCV